MNMEMFISGLSGVAAGGVVTGVVVKVVIDRFLKRYEILEQKVDDTLERRIKLLEEKPCSMLDRLKTAEESLKAVNVPLIMDKIETVVRQNNSIDLKLTQLLDDNGTQKADIKNNRTYIDNLNQDFRDFRREIQNRG